MTRIPASPVGAPTRRLVLFGLFGVGNLGNDATLWVTLHHLRRRLPSVEIACVCPKLPDFAHEFALQRLDLDPLVPRGQWRIPIRIARHAYVAVATLLTEPFRRRRVARQFGDAERLVVVGTGALDDFGEMPWGMPAWILRWARVARRRGAAVELLAVGVGPIHRRPNRWLMHRAVDLATERTYRDTVSRDYVARHGLSKPTDAVVPDLAFAVPSEWIRSAPAAGSPPRVVGVGLMGYFGWKNDRSEGQPTYRAYIEKMAAFVRWLLEKGYEVRLIIGELGTDEAAVGDVWALLGMQDPSARHPKLTAPPIRGALDVLSELAKVDLVVASRFHNVVFALTLGRPVVALGYAEKFNALMADMGLTSYCQHIESVDVERLKTQFLELTGLHAEAVARIRARVEAYRQRLESLFDESFAATPGVGRPAA